MVFSPEMEPHALWNARDCSDMVDWLRIHESKVEQLEECIRWQQYICFKFQGPELI